MKFEKCPICDKKGLYYTGGSHFYLTKTCRYCKNYYAIAKWSVTLKPYAGWVYFDEQTVKEKIKKKREIYQKQTNNA